MVHTTYPIWGFPFLFWGTRVPHSWMIYPGVECLGSRSERRWAKLCKKRLPLIPRKSPIFWPVERWEMPQVLAIFWDNDDHFEIDNHLEFSES